MDFDVNTPVTRRGVLRLGGGAAVGLIGAGSMLRAGALPAVAAAPAGAGSTGTLPVDQIEDILEAEGTVNNGVLSIGLDRTDIGTVHIHGVPIKPSFEVNGSLNFQPIGHNQAFFNGDLPLKDSEVDPFIDELLDEGLVFQAEHQHFYDFDPPVWFIHWRGAGDPLALARSIRHCLNKTSTPLPQGPSPNPTTPFDAERLQDILHGYRHDIGSDGVVTVYVARRNPIHIGGVLVQPDTNIAHNISFEPLNSTGSRAAAAPDFGMEAGEVNAVVRTMRQQGWDVGCLYNQETDEHPQLFFSHMFRTGDPYDLAAQVRRGLDRTNTA